MLILGLRGERIGTDTSTYNSYFNYLESGLGYMEPAWNLLTIALKGLGISATFFNLIIAFISLYLICYVVWKDSKNPIASLFFLYSLGFYFFMFNGMRQAFAMSIVLLAMHFYCKGKKKISIGIIILASLFHTSAFIALLIFIVPLIRISSRWVYFILLLTALIGISIPIYSLENIAGKYSNLVTEMGVRDNLFSMLIYLFSMNVFFIYIWIHSRNNKSYDKWLYIYLISMVLFNIFIQSNLALRIVFYLSISAVIFLPDLFKSNSSMKIVIILYVFLNFAHYMIPEYSNWGKPGSLVPYEFSNDFINFLGSWTII